MTGPRSNRDRWFWRDRGRSSRLGRGQIGPRCARGGDGRGRGGSGLRRGGEESNPVENGRGVIRKELDLRIALGNRRRVGRRGRAGTNVGIQSVHGVGVGDQICFESIWRRSDDMRVRREIFMFAIKSSPMVRDDQPANPLSLWKHSNSLIFFFPDHLTDPTSHPSACSNDLFRLRLRLP